MSAGRAARLAPALSSALERALEGVLGGAVRLAGAEALGGGCVNPSARLTTERGERFFVKWNPRAPADLFAVEADGLRALRTAAGAALRVPEVLAVGRGGGGSPPWLLLEYIEPGRAGPAYASALGAGLASLHRAPASGGWGWERDNFIGPLPQANAAAPTWGEFWRDRRLAPQLKRARAAGRFRGADAGVRDRAVDSTPELLAGVDEPASLLHGDLWGGNVLADGEGRPALIDPAAYRGHREVDLAMSELFGGFPPGWPRAYSDSWPLDEGYARGRRALYQLYYLLVHVNLFGAGYESGSLAAARAALYA